MNRNFPIPVSCGPPIVDTWGTYEGELVIDYGGMARWVGVYLKMKDGRRLLVESHSGTEGPAPLVDTLTTVLEQLASRLDK